MNDVLHTTFSHVVDFVFDYSGEDYHEEIVIRVIRDSEEPIILTNYEYNDKGTLFDESKRIMASKICILLPLRFLKGDYFE